MPGTLLQVDSQGRLKLKDDKLIIAGANDPCCCNDRPPCGFCIGEGSHIVPFVRMTISGLGSGNGFCQQTLPVHIGNLNGAYDLTIADSACRVAYEADPVAGQFIQCGGFPPVTRFRIFFTRLSTFFWNINLQAKVNQTYYTFAVASLPPGQSDLSCGDFPMDMQFQEVNQIYDIISTSGVAHVTPI